MLDTDLAKIYDVETRILKRAVRENIQRFPSDFMFELSSEEFENLRSKFGISSLESLFDGEFNPILRSKIETLGLNGDSRLHGGNRYMPFVFTELGIGMLSSVLRSKRAIQVNIGIMRAFVQLRRQPNWTSHIELLEQRISQLESKSNPAINDNNRVLLIQSTVAGYWGLQVEDLQSATRKKSISLARQVAIYLIRKQMQLSYSEIGAHFGERDHTTILHAYRKILFASGNNRMLHETLMFLEASLRGIQPAQLRSLPA